ncbi:helix-turn-helix domain-containing protein [Clostridium perfringens]
MDTIENKLKELILTKYKSLREFTLKIGMPYSTFDTILKRGVDKANIINILKICNELDISADKLANGIIEYNNVEKDTYSINLSKEETTLLENYNKLNKFGKNKVINYTKDLIEMPKYQKDNVTTLPKREKQIWEEPGKEYLMPIACHDDNLTDEEKDFMDEAIAEYERTHKK